MDCSEFKMVEKVIRNNSVFLPRIHDDSQEIKKKNSPIKKKRNLLRVLKRYSGGVVKWSLQQEIIIFFFHSFVSYYYKLTTRYHKYEHLANLRVRKKRCVKMTVINLILLLLYTISNVYLYK